MPIYEVHHSYPLQGPDKSALAQAITKLHATTFTTLSLFVHVRFVSHDATDQTYFVGGQPRVTSTNRILALVRTSPARTKASYDALAEKIEEAWKDVIYGDVITDGKDAGKRRKEVDETERDRSARQLLAVAFSPLLAAREIGLVIPEAGKEAGWLKETIPHFRKLADERGDEDAKGLLEELETREDLKKLLGGGGLVEKLSGLTVGNGDKKE